jgi:hypothetical protein
MRITRATLCFGESSMAARSNTLNRLGLTLGAVGASMPGLALAHGTDHLHFWGRHTAEGQGWALALAVLALAGIGWWVWRSRG